MKVWRCCCCGAKLAEAAVPADGVVRIACHKCKAMNTFRGDGTTPLDNTLVQDYTYSQQGAATFNCERQRP